MVLEILVSLSLSAGISANISSAISTAVQSEAIAEDDIKETNTAGIVKEISGILKTASKRAYDIKQAEMTRAENIKNISIPIDKDDANMSLMLTPYHNCYLVGKERRMVLDVAELYIGQIGYRWGAKADENNEIGEYLDCSGFTQFIFKDVLDTDIGMGTFMQSKQSREISKDELLPGDLGFRYKWSDVVIRDEFGNPILDELGNEQTRINHVGIYYGKDDNGNDLWIHCSSAANGVTISTVNDFIYFTTPFAD